MWQRIYPKTVTLIGGLGLGLALTYFVGVVLAFVPGWEEWAEFFVPRALYLLIAPYVLLVGHLVLRNHVGRFLLGRGAYEEAVEYGTRRVEASLLRSKREVANQRIVAARGHIALGAYGEAEELLVGGPDDFPGSYAMEARRWLFEIALRRDDRDRCAELVVDDPGEADSARGELAAVLACDAEFALREDDENRYRERIEDALWEQPGHSRITMTRALAMVQYEAEDEESDEVADLLESLQESMAEKIPARGTEILALRAKIADRRERHEQAGELLDEARGGPTDDWTKRVVDEVASTIET